MYRDDDVSNPKMKVMKPLAQRTVAKFQEHNELGQKEAHDDVSKSKMQLGKLLAQTTHVAQFQGQVRLDSKKHMLMCQNSRCQKRIYWLQQFSIPVSRTHSEIGQ
jgi:hypothetical protein